MKNQTQWKIHTSFFDGRSSLCSYILTIAFGMREIKFGAREDMRRFWQTDRRWRIQGIPDRRIPVHLNIHVGRGHVVSKGKLRGHVVSKDQDSRPARDASTRCKCQKIPYSSVWSVKPTTIFTRIRKPNMTHWYAGNYRMPGKKRWKYTDAPETRCARFRYSNKFKRDSMPWFIP